MNTNLSKLSILTGILTCCGLLCFFQIPEHASGNDDVLTVAFFLKKGEQLKSSNIDGACSALQDAAKIIISNPQQNIGNIDKTLELLSTFGRAADSLDHVQTAIQCYKSGLDILGLWPEKKQKEKAQMLLDLGISQRNNNDLQEALGTFEQALKWNKTIHGEISAPVGDCYSHIGALYASLGDFHEAIQYFQKQYNLSLIYNHGKSKWLSYPLCNMAAAYAELENYEKAAELYEQGLFLGGDMHGQQHYFWVTLGNYYLKANDLNNAERAYSKALDLKLKIYHDALNTEIGTVYRNLGEVYFARGQTAPADSLYRLSFDILEKNIQAVPVELVKTCLSLAAVQQIKKDNAQALLLIERAIALCYPQSANNSKVPVIQARYPQELSEALMLKGDVFIQEASYKSGAAALADLSIALNAYEQAVSCVGSIYRAMQEDASKSFLIKQAMPKFEKAISTAFTLFERAGKTEWEEKLFALIEKSKSNLLLESVRQTGAKQFAGLPVEVMEQERRLRQKKLEIMADLEMNFEYGSSETDEFVKTLRDSLFAVDLSHQKLVTELAQTFPEYYRLKYDTSVTTLVAVKESIRSNNQTIIEFFWGSDFIYAIGITADGGKCIKIPIDQNLRDDIASMKLFLTKYDNKSASKRVYLVAAHNLYKRLFAPLTFQNKTKKVIIIPDGGLQALPFQALLTALPDDNSSYKNLPYLVLDYDISFAYSCQILLQPLSKRQKRISFGGFAPDYGHHELQNGAGKGTLAQKDSSTIKTAVVNQGHFSPLYFNKKEVEQIAGSMAGDKYLNSHATEANFKAQASRYRILHLAMHGLANDSFPGQSQLIFSEKNEAVEDGRLFAHEIYALDLQADLAVLSACETGKGRLEEGEGTLSLGRAFSFAGCSSIIVSNWNVNDAVATQLMQAFYKTLGDNVDYIRSLEEAKRKFIQQTEDERLAHPHYWATYTLIGGHLEAETDFTNKLLLFLAVTTLFTGLLYTKFKKRRKYL